MEAKGPRPGLVWSAWVSPLEQRWGERCRMELGPSGSCPERYPYALSFGVQERAWTAALSCPAALVRAGFLPSDADEVQPGLCLLRFGFIGAKINLNCAVPNWKWLEMLPRHLN